MTTAVKYKVILWASDSAGLAASSCVDLAPPESNNRDQTDKHYHADYLCKITRRYWNDTPTL